MIDADVAIDIEKTKRPAVFCDAALRQLAAQQFGAIHCGKACELSPQCFHLRCSVKTDDSTQIGRGMLLQSFGTFDSHERQKDEGNHRCPQTVEGGTDASIYLTCNREEAACFQSRDGEEDTGSRDAGSRGEQWWRVIEKTQGGKESIQNTIQGITIEASRDLPISWITPITLGVHEILRIFGRGCDFTTPSRHLGPLRNSRGRILLEKSKLLARAGSTSDDVAFCGSSSREDPA